MSLGGIIGGIVGGIVGFFIGGPVGAAIGAGLGAGLGMMIDPVEPDGPTPGEPGRVTVNTAQEGSPVPDGLGTVKFNGNIIWAGNERSVEIKEEVEGGKGGGSQEVSKGFEYFLTWAIAICKGPISRLYTIYSNDKIVWHGDLEIPESGGMVSITLDGMGACDFYFGTADQLYNPYMTQGIIDEFEPQDWWEAILHEILIAPTEEEQQAILSAAASDSLIPAYRGLCYAVMKDCSLGNYNRAPSMFVVAEKHPSIEGLSDEYKSIETYDYNPAFAAYYVLNKMTGLPSEYLDEADFNDAARILAGEARGLSIGINTAQEALTYLESILIHISAGIRWAGDSALHLFLFRETHDPDLLPEYVPDQMLGEPTMSRNSWLATENEVKVQYSKRVFREPLCPTGCDGFKFLGPAGPYIGNETLHFQIENPDWNLVEDDETCDLAFLSDGLSPERSGEFYSGTHQGEGVWEIAYRTNPLLCEGQDDPARYCPTICGRVLPCCPCELLTPPSVNSTISPDFMAVGSMVFINWENGQPPFEISIEPVPFISGFDFWLDDLYTKKTLTTSSREQALYTTGSACGSVNFRITDSCGQIFDWTVRSAAGKWTTLINRQCYISGGLPAGSCCCGDIVTIGAYRYHQTWWGGNIAHLNYLGVLFDAFPQVPYPGTCGQVNRPSGQCTGCYDPGYHWGMCVSINRPCHQRKDVWECS